MKKVTKGIFVSDIHLPWNVNIEPVFKYIQDFKPDTIILGGDIIDASNMHGVDSFRPEQFKMEWYDRDVKLLKEFLAKLNKVNSNSTMVYLEGNHEERYTRLSKKYPDLFKTKFDFQRDIGFKGRWIKYGDYDSFYRIGDCIFTHGTVYPDNHAKKYAITYTPYKVVYGHLHHFGAYTTHTANPRLPARYSITAGCLCSRLPDYKKGQPNQWVNGFISFVTIDGVTTPTAHIIENDKFNVGNKIYA